ncbi:MAG: hypothetical protein GAK34_03372 [Delftia tsuruhatensis]|nr:MAG: hypothetical protein GAK34_03372 [Delftia tsuruhatensis]
MQPEELAEIHAQIAALRRQAARLAAQATAPLAWWEPYAPWALMGLACMAGVVIARVWGA